LDLKLLHRRQHYQNDTRVTNDRHQSSALTQDTAKSMFRANFGAEKLRTPRKESE
jgi:hypothetical protein